MIQEFERATSVADAVMRAREGYVFLAGGTQVNNAPFKKWGRPVEKAVSIEGVGLTGIAISDDEIAVGAAVTLQEIADSENVPESLRNAAMFIPTRSVRNIATIGGNIGAARPDSYLIPALIALGARAEIATIASAAGDSADQPLLIDLPVEEYVSAGHDELIVRILIPANGSLRGCVRAIKESRSHLSLPVVSAAVRVAGNGGRVTDCVIAVGCVADVTVRLKSVERALVDGTIPASALKPRAGDTGNELENAIAGAIDPRDGTLGSAEFKRYLNSVAIADALRSCAREAGV